MATIQELNEIIKQVDKIDEANLRTVIGDIKSRQDISPTLRFLLCTTPLLIDTKDQWENATLQITDDVGNITITAGNGQNKFVVHFDEIGVPEMIDLSHKYINDIEYVPEINKRLLGRAIIQYCGNEGMQNNKTTTSLRKLFQLGIDKIHHAPDSKIWTNATIVIYDDQSNSYTFQSGKGKHRFVANEIDGEQQLVYTIGNKQQKIHLNDGSATGCILL